MTILSGYEKEFNKALYRYTNEQLDEMIIGEKFDCWRTPCLSYVSCYTTSSCDFTKDYVHLFQTELLRRSQCL